MTTAFVRKLVVEVVEARDLLPKDGQGSSNPYVVVDFDGQRKRTQTKIRELNPKWEEMLEFVVVDPNTMEAEELDVEVYNDKRFGSGNGRKNHFLGRIRIYASQFPKKGDEGLIFFPLEKKSFFSWVRGEIGLKIYYVDELVEEPPPPPPTDPPPPPPAEEEPPKPDHPPPLGPDDKFPMPTDAAIEAQEQNPPPIIVGEEMRSGPPNEASALHEKEERRKNGVTGNQFFIIASICSFAYYVLPGYLFSMLTSLSLTCWIFPNSVLAHQLGSGFHGLGVGVVGLDWSTISSYLGSPLASPWFATANTAVGFVILTYVITPTAYWLNIYSAKTFPIFSDGLFTSSGDKYNISSIIDSNFHLDVKAYERNGPLYLSTFFAITYGVGFATLAATIVHVVLFYGRDIWQLSKSAFKEKPMDVHTRLMSVYKQVPEWWFVCILLTSITTTIFACEYYNDQLQLPWWGVLLGCAVAIFFTLPVGIIAATTNQVYGHISMSQAITFLQDFKLGNYMKIPPRTMFMAQVVGTFIAAVVYLGTAWWLMDTVPDICNKSLLPANSPWTCPFDRVFYDASVIWGLIGPRRIFGDLGTYSVINRFFLAGALAPLLVWLAHKAFPNHHWIRLINMPILIGTTRIMPPATVVNYTSWVIVGFISGFIVYRYQRVWWQRHNYVLSGALDVGLAFMGVLLYLCLGSENITLNWWGSNIGDNDCPLASCPTAKGIVVKGCPVF